MAKRSLIRHLIIYMALLAAPCTAMFAQQSFKDSYNATYITLNDGLAHNFIDDIYKDSQGFLWIAMEGGGLSRYDGYEFVNYSPDSPTCPLKSNFVCNVVEDRFHRLWVASEGGLDIIDLTTRKPTQLLSTHHKTMGMGLTPTTLVLCDSKGCVWAHCGDHVFRISFDDNGNIASVHTMPAPPAMERQVALKDLEKDGSVWLGMNGRLTRLSLNSKNELQSRPIASCLTFEAGTVFSDIIEKENEVWIATNNGLFRYNRQKNVVKLYEYSAKDICTLSQNWVTALAVTKDKQLIAASLKGLNIYDPLNDNFERIESNPSDKGNLLNSNFVNCMFVDEKHIWLGTESGGINKLTLKRLSTNIYRHDRDNPQSLSPNPVNAIYEDEDGVLWVGTVEGGLNRKLPGSESFSHYTSEGGALSHNSVSAITADANGRLWVGTWGGGITLLDRKQPQKNIAGEVKLPKGKSPIDFVGALEFDKINNGVWIGSNDGIFFYDINEDKIYSPLAGRNVRGCIGSLIDKEGHLWMGCREGVYIIDLHKRKKQGANATFSYRHLKYKLDNPSSRVLEKITCFHQSADGTLWLGSNGFGIYKRTTGKDGKERFTAYTTAQGLASNSVRSILEDKNGCIWISTNYGLSRFVVATECFINYYTPDGLSDPQFYWNAACQATGNRMYFGSMTGMTAIKGDLPQLPPSQPRLHFTRLCVENEEVLPGGKLLPKDISITDEIRIHERYQSFTVEFSSLSFDDNATYSYRLEGFDKKWNEAPAGRNVATYTNLSPGHYTLLVEYSTKGQEEAVSTIELKIVILPYFYKTPWFIGLMIVLLTLAVWQAYQWRIRNLKRQSNLLHQKVEQRTHELNMQKQLLEQKTDELSRQNKTLVEQNEKITLQKSQLTKMTKKIRELTFDRIAFFTNITHEFRTPITLIIGPIERALKLSYNPQVIEQLHFVERNSKYLLSLVNQLMDFRKVESGKMQINKHPHNFTNFINELVNPFVIFAQERGISIQLRIRLATPELSYDEEAMHKVLTNLLSNAIKFTPNGGRIRLYATLLDNDNDETADHTLYICVSDTGNGVPPADINKIFNRFFQSKGQTSYPMYGQSGSGIGLYLCKRIVQMHNGEIYARNNKRAGCSFRILLPLSAKDQQAEALAEQAEATKMPVSAENGQHAENKRSGMCILVVEDNPDMRSFIRSILEEKYQVVEASDGMEALHKLETHNIDFIVCDLMMPNMDGIELSRRVKENIATSHIPFLMLTAKTSQKSRVESYQVGVDGYLLKPFDEDLLMTRISNILENRKRNQRQFAINPDLEAMGIQPENEEKQFINRVMEVIKANYKDPFFDVNNFCEAMGNSRTYLNKKMRELLGNSISQYIRLYRLNLARQIILAQEGKSKNVADIAYEVGFNDPKYFSRCFQKEFNIKPHELMTQTSHTSTPGQKDKE